MRLGEGPNGYLFVLHDVEDGIQLCNLHHVMNIFCEIEQLQFSLLLLHACEGTRLL